MVKGLYKVPDPIEFLVEDVPARGLHRRSHCRFQAIVQICPFFDEQLMNAHKKQIPRDFDFLSTSLTIINISKRIYV